MAEGCAIGMSQFQAAFRLVFQQVRNAELGGDLQSPAYPESLNHLEHGYRRRVPVKATASPSDPLSPIAKRRAARWFYCGNATVLKSSRRAAMRPVSDWSMMARAARRGCRCVA
jgi:hypothetical protein